MLRRTFLGTVVAAANTSTLMAALRGGRWDDAAEVLERSTATRQVEAAALHKLVGKGQLPVEEMEAV